MQQLSKWEEQIKQARDQTGDMEEPVIRRRLAKTKAKAKPKPVLHLFLVSPPLLRVEQTLHVSYLFTLRNLSAEHASVVGLGIHQCQSSRRRGFVFRIIVNWVQAMRSGDPDPTVSRDG